MSSTQRSVVTSVCRPEGIFSTAQSSPMARARARFVPGAARLRMRSMSCLSGKTTLNYIKINSLIISERTLGTKGQFAYVPFSAIVYTNQRCQVVHFRTLTAPPQAVKFTEHFASVFGRLGVPNSILKEKSRAELRSQRVSGHTADVGIRRIGKKFKAGEYYCAQAFLRHAGGPQLRRGVAQDSNSTALPLCVHSGCADWHVDHYRHGRLLHAHVIENPAFQQTAR